uniref:Uncharacterized protein n=1 Tax=Vespula pensylvanica TaxID=30213 RepID=A0A834P2G7_VESPE|nr:hypothetical protein H0235_008063 [Vespula pensylvanica]
MQKGEQRLFSGGNIICNVTPLDTKDDTLASFLEKEGKFPGKYSILAGKQVGRQAGRQADRQAGRSNGSMPDSEHLSLYFKSTNDALRRNLAKIVYGRQRSGCGLRLGLRLSTICSCGKTSYK